MLQNLIESVQILSSIGSRRRIKKNNKAKFLIGLRLLAITATVNNCETKDLRTVVIDLYSKLRVLHQDLELPSNIFRKINAVTDRITELQQVTPNSKDETIAIHKAVVALCNLDKLLG